MCRICIPPKSGALYHFGFSILLKQPKATPRWSGYVLVQICNLVIRVKDFQSLPSKNNPIHKHIIPYLCRPQEITIPRWKYSVKIIELRIKKNIMSKEITHRDKTTDRAKPPECCKVKTMCYPLIRYLCNS